MSPDYDPRAQCGRGVGSAGLGLPPAHSLRQAPRATPGQEARPAQKERETRRRKTSHRRRTGLCHPDCRVRPGGRPCLGPAAPTPALSQTVLVPLSVFSLATAPGSSLPGLGKALNSFSLLRSVPVSLPSLLNNSLHHHPFTHVWLPSATSDGVAMHPPPPLIAAQICTRRAGRAPRR